jgi:CubicO group peptidase (beta-lactamase class C family)
MRHRRVATALFTFAIAFTATASPLDDIISRYNDYGFGGVVLIERGGKIILHRAYGPADRKNNIANTPATRFPIASITKSFTAAAVMQLVAAGKISLSDPLSRFISPLPDDKAKITVEQLLTHTAGLPEEAKDLATAKLEFTPGEKYEYSNSAYNVLATIVEKASGENFRDYIARHIVAPAKLTATSFDPAGIAVGYAGPADDPQPTTPPTYEDKYGSGALFSNALDLLRFAHAFQRGAIVDKKSVAKMQAGDPRGPMYGWDGVKTESGHRVFDDGGDWDGYKSDLRIYPEDDLIIIVLANVRPNTFRWNTALIRNLERAIFKNRAPVVPPRVMPATIDLKGDFVTTTADRLHIAPANGALSVSAFGQQAIDLLAFPHAQHPTEMTNAAAMSLEVIDALRAADATKLATVSESVGSVDTFAKWWATRLAPEHGNFVGATILGTAPKGPSRYETFVRAEMEKGPATIRVVWRRGSMKLVAVGLGVDIPFGASFRPIGDGVFASFDVPAEEIVTLEKRGDDVVLKRGAAELIAHR